MPRKAHIDTPSAQHQVIIDRTECKAIFKDNADRKNFTARLDRIISETQTRCYGWALMTNHFHLLFKTGMPPLATVMRRSLIGYAVNQSRFQRVYRRHGQLFQNRYKSFLCEEKDFGTQGFASRAMNVCWGRLILLIGC